MNKETINVIFCGDRLIFKGIYLCALTILNRTHRKLHFYLMTMKVDSRGKKGEAMGEKERKLLEDAAKSVDIDNEVTLIDVTKDYQATIAKTPNNKCYYSPYCMIRLFAERYVIVDKAIYLDADTMSVNSLEEFEKYDISNIELAAAIDYLGRWWIGEHYYNSGVLYLNMKKIREETHLFERSIELLLSKKLFFADQSALNNLCNGFIELPDRFNDQRHVKKDTVISHYPKHVIRFYDPIKPWQIDKMHKINKIFEFDKEYDYYLKHFPVKDYE